MDDAQYLEWIANHMVSFRPNAPNIGSLMYVNGKGKDTLAVYHDKNDLHPPILSLLKGAIQKAISDMANAPEVPSGIGVEPPRQHG